MDDIFQIAQIQKRALARMDAGSKKYGKYDPSEDTRDLFQEMEDELLDAMNYLAMQVWKLRYLRDKTGSIPQPT